MKERPTLFRAPEVLALLDGSKTKMRLVVKPQPEAHQHIARHLGDGDWQFVPDVHILADGVSTLRSPYGQPGDRLWAREKWRGIVNIAPPGSYEYAVARYIPDREYCRRVEYAAPQPQPERQSVPAGYVLVPIEPTPDMVRAGWGLLPSPAGNKWDIGASRARVVYRAMLAAAPQPQPVQGETK